MYVCMYVCMFNVITIYIIPLSYNVALLHPVTHSKSKIL